MPTDTKLNNLVINYLTQEQYDAIESPNENELYLTPDNSTGGGGNSLTLELTDFSTDEPITRTSITEEEKTNLESGKYGFILYYDPSWGETAEAEMMVTLPQIFKNFLGSYIIIVYSGHMSNDLFSISGLLPYRLDIGEKNTDGTYPITITKTDEIPFAAGGGGGDNYLVKDIVDDSVTLTNDEFKKLSESNCTLVLRETNGHNIWYYISSLKIVSSENGSVSEIQVDAFTWVSNGKQPKRCATLWMSSTPPPPTA